MADLKNVDAPPQAPKEEEFPAKNNAWKVYLQPRWITKILYNNSCFFGTIMSLGYICEMVGFISSANFYSDADRLLPCEFRGPLKDSEASSAVLDMPILLMGIFHLLSWLRMACLFCVIFLGINLMQVWYLTTPATIFGIVSYVILFMTYFSEDGEACAAVQVQRG